MGNFRLLGSHPAMANRTTSTKYLDWGLFAGPGGKNKKKHHIWLPLFFPTKGKSQVRVKSGLPILICTRHF